MATIKIYLIPCVVIFFFGLVMTGCGPQKPVDQASNVDSTEQIQADTAALGPPVAEIITYRSKTHHGYELTGIFPANGSPIFLVTADEKTRVLSLPAAGGSTSAAKPDNEFNTLEFTADAKSELTQIPYATSVELLKKDDAKVTFEQVMIKRGPMEIGNTYGDTTAFGKVDLEKNADPTVLNFKATQKTCNTSGAMLLKYNVGFFQRSEVTGSSDCVLIFWFTEAALQIFQVSDNKTCNCELAKGSEAIYPIQTSEK